MNAFQIGLCTFKWCKNTHTYVARPFNIYLFPHSENNIGDEWNLLFTTGCMKFNVKNNFNFNKLIKTGVNYRRLTERESIHKLCVTKIDEANGGKLGPISWQM